jgi:hypothetical protein
MKLFELAAPNATRQIAKVFESYFGPRIRFEDLTQQQAQRMLTRVRSVLAEHRSTVARHQSERDPDYLKLIMMEQALTARIHEQSVGGVAAPGGAVGGTAQTTPAQQQAGINKVMSQFSNPKVKTALRKHMMGQRLTPQETQLVQGAQMTMTENRSLRQRLLRESEIQQAQVVLAAQDMVDKMQDMLEEVTELQFKELPALVDSIKNQVGMDQAQQFNTDATAALSGLVQNLQGAKQQMETALGVVTGQAAPVDAAAAAALGAPAAPDMAAGMPPGGEVEVDAVDVDAEIPADDEEEPIKPSTAALGRAKR